MKILIISITIVSILVISCKKNDVECFDTVTRSFFPNKENQKLLDNIAGKTLQYRDSLGNKLDFIAQQILPYDSKFFYKDPCGWHDWAGVGEHYRINKPHIFMLSRTIPIYMIYTLSFQFEEVYPNLVGKELLEICLIDSTQFCTRAIVDLSPVGNTQVLNNPFKNMYIGDQIFTIKKNVIDPIGEQRLFKNVWKAAFNITTLGNNYHIQASKQYILYAKTDEKIPYELYFNNTHGLIAFRYKDGALWMQYGSF